MSTQKSLLAPLLRIAERGIPFTSACGQAFLRLPASTSALPIRSHAFRDWFFDQFFAEHNSLPSSRAFKSLLALLEARAAIGPYTHRVVSRRLAALGPGLIPDRILLDLADPDSRFVDIRPSNWSLAEPSNEVIFHSSRASLPIPAPTHTVEGSPLDLLRNLLHLPDLTSWLRCLAWLLAAFRPSGPYPILVLQGPPSSGKTFAARLLRTLVDPSTAPLTPLPRSVNQLHDLARDNWILAFDHVSALPPSLTDALCRLSSGAGAALREPGRDTPLQQPLARPILLTVTGRWAPPPDLAARTLTVTLPDLPDDARRPELDLIAHFELSYPAILGALCTAVSVALRRLPQLVRTAPRARHRYADTQLWALAAAPALACTEQEMQSVFDPIPPPPPIVASVAALIEQAPHWSGTATQLLEAIHSTQSTKSLSQHLRQLTLTLSDYRIDIAFRRRNGAREISLQDASPPSPPCPQPLAPEEVAAA